MTGSIAATPPRGPQYGHFRDVVPGAYSSRAPHCVQWNVRVPGVVTGGAGAAVAASSGAEPGWSVMASRSRDQGAAERRAITTAAAAAAPNRGRPRAPGRPAPGATAP